MTVSGKLLRFCCLMLLGSTDYSAAYADGQMDELMWVRWVDPAEQDEADRTGDDLPWRSGQPVTFGLTVSQRRAIYDWTAGAVDLRSIYRVASSEDQQAQLRLLPRRERGFSRPQFLGKVPEPISPLAGLPQLAATDALSERASADPDLAGQGWLDDLGVTKAWQLATGKGVTIADCDSGYHTQESDLAANLLLDERRDFSDASRPMVVTDGAFVFHGTAVAAILAGVRDGRGVNGVAYDAKVIPLQNYNYDRNLDNLDKEEATARCILHALRLPSVRIILVENQTPTGSSETFAGTRDVIRLAIQSGITVVGAAGNNSLELRAEAEDDSGSIIVGAVRRSGRRAIFTNWGSRVTISAYGEGIRTLYGPEGQIEPFGGTTAAAAQVAGVVALMHEVNPSLTPEQVRLILTQTRRIIIDNAIVGGLIDAEAAVRRAAQMPVDRAVRERQESLRASVQSLLRTAHFAD